MRCRAIGTRFTCLARGPIVLMCRRASMRISNHLADAVAPHNPLLGIMLPYTPLHHLLLDAIGTPLVMTSGNRKDEPIAYREPECYEQLAGLADLFLTHDRAIHVRCDDSVTRVVNRAELPIRRSRGYAPRPVPLPIATPLPVLAVGGQMKCTFALALHRRQSSVTIWAISTTSRLIGRLHAISNCTKRYSISGRRPSFAISIRTTRARITRGSGRDATVCD